MTDLKNNIYYRLGLFVDPYETNWTKLCTEIKKKRNEYNALPGDKGKPLAQFANRFLVRYQGGADTTKEGDAEFPSAFDAHSEGEAARDARLKSLKEQIKLDLADGVLEQSEYDATKKKHGRFFKESTIQTHYGEYYPPFTYPKPIKPKSISDGEAYEVDSATWKGIERELELCGKDNLYAFIDVHNTGFNESTPQETIQKNISIAHSFWKGKGKSTAPDVSAATKIFEQKYLELCLGDEKKRSGYDLTRKRQVFKKFAADANIAQKENIENTEWKTYREILQGKGLSEEEAEYFLWEFCTTRTDDKKKPKPIKLPVKPVSKTDKVFCPDPRCSEVNEKTAKSCRKCGTPIVVTCPGLDGKYCGKEGHIRDRTCTSCGFEIGNMPIALRLIKEVREALAKGDLSEIENKIRQINTYWRDAPGAEELRKEWEKIKRERGDIQKEIAEMRAEVTKGNFYKAKTLLEILKLNPHTALQIKSDDKKISETLSDVDAKLKSLSSISDNEKKIDVCEKILETVKDCAKAIDLLAKIPPSPPANLKAADFPSGGFKLTWQSPNNTRRYTYKIVRKIGGCPSSTADGTLIADTVAATEHTDTHVEIGAIYGYTVFTQRGVAEDTVGCRSNLAQRVGEVTNIQVLPSDKMLTVSWQGSKYAIGIQIERYLGNAKTGTPTKIIPQNATSFSDGNLTNGQYYTYNIISIFRDDDGKPFPSPGKIAQGKPQQPPPAISDLAATEQGNVVNLKWTPPKYGRVLLFDCADKPAVNFGDTSIATAKSLQEKYGDQITVLDATSGATTWTNTATGVRYVLPVTWEDELAVFGNIAELVRIEDVTNVAIRDNGTKLRLTWNWAKGLQKVRIVYSDRSPPTGPNDPNATVIKDITLSEYSEKKAFEINSPSQGYYFSIFSVIEQNGKIKYSSGVKKETKQTIIKYVVAVKRKFWFFGPKYVKISIHSESEIPTLVVLGRKDKALWNREGTWIDDIQASSQKQITHILRHGALKEISHIKLFVKDEQLAEKFYIDSPDSRKLKIG